MKLSDAQSIRFVFVGFLFISVAFGTTVGVVAAQSDGSVDVDVTTLDGSGTADDPYQITNSSELQAIEDNRTAHYELAEDIDAGGTSEWNSGQGFAPLHSSQSLPFEGELDGDGHSISDLSINRPLTDRVGLFAVVGGGEISNVTLSNATITGSDNTAAVVGRNDAFTGSGTITNVRVTETDISGDENVGIVVGFSNGAIRTTTAAGTVAGTTNIGGVVGNNSASGVIERSVADASVSATGDYAGGLVGTNDDGSITTSSSTSSVSGNVSGGLIGLNIGTVMKSYAKGSVSGSQYAGGLVGDNTGTVENTYARGDVSPVNESEASAIGGLVGRHFTSDAINSSYSTGDVTALNGSTDSSGGLLGERTTSFGIPSPVNDNYFNTTTQSGSHADTDGITELQAAEMTGTAAETNMDGFSFGTDWSTRSDGFPVLAWEPTVNIENQELTPDTVSTSATNHTLRFDVTNVSADGEPDELSVELPDSVPVGNINSLNASYLDTDESISTAGEDYNGTTNTITFTVDPVDAAANRDLSVEMELQLAAQEQG